MIFSVVANKTVRRKCEFFVTTRLGAVKVRKDNATHIGMDVFQKDDGSAEITQKNFTDVLRLIATSPSLWRDRNKPQSVVEPQICQNKLGEL